MKRVLVPLVLIVFLLGCTGSDQQPPPGKVKKVRIQPFNLSKVLHDPARCTTLGASWGWYTTSGNRSYCLPNSLEMCLQHDGFWGVIDDSGKSVCNIHASDDGKFCTDSRQCLGDCVASLNVEDMKKLTLYMNESVKTNGTCSEYVITTGPVAEVEKGYVHLIKTYE